jgi:hypothetical protein
MKKYMKWFSMIGLIGATVACKTLPPVAPSGEQPAVLVASFKLVPPIGMGGFTPGMVFFARVNARGDIDPKADFIVSTYTNGNRAYLLNAAPGEYVAIGAAYAAPNAQGQQPAANLEEASKQLMADREKLANAGEGSIAEQAGATDLDSMAVYLFADELVKSTRVRVLPGKITIMGVGESQSTMSNEFTDALQKKYVAYFTVNAKQTPRIIYAGSNRKFERTPAIEAEKIAEVKEDFKETPWATVY